MGCQPFGDGAVNFTEVEEHAGIVDGGFDLQTISNDSRVAHEACAVGVGVVGYDPNVEVVVGAPETLPLFQNRQPGQACLVDLEEEPLEKTIVIGNRKTVFLIVVRAMEGVIPGHDTVATQYRWRVDHGGL